VACPYFRPETPIADWPFPPRAPLGQPYDGICSAAGSRPPASTVRECCNFGYVRGRCPSFPEDARADAHRFTAWESNGGLRVVWVVERDYQPVEYGEFEWRPDADPPRGAAPVEILIQGCAFARWAWRRARDEARR